MFWKLAIVIVGVCLIGAALLGMRAQRQQLLHDIAQLHVEVDRTRHQTWDMQVRIAQRVAPESLTPAVERAGLELEPATPADPWPHRFHHGRMVRTPPTLGAHEIDRP